MPVMHYQGTKPGARFIKEEGCFRIILVELRTHFNERLNIFTQPVKNFM
jgi:hypothetical protein